MAQEIKFNQEAINLIKQCLNIEYKFGDAKYPSFKHAKEQALIYCKFKIEEAENLNFVSDYWINMYNEVDKIENVS